MNEKADENQRTRFWTALDVALSKQPNRLPKLTYKSERAKRVNLGKEAYISVKVLTQKNLLVVEFRTDGAQADFYYRQLLEQQSEIDRELGGSPRWRAEAKNRRRQIMIDRSVDLADESQWPEYIDWLIVKLNLFHRVFAPRVQELRTDFDAS